MTTELVGSSPIPERQGFRKRVLKEIVLYKSESDVMMYVVGGVDENEILLYVSYTGPNEVQTTYII